MELIKNMIEKNGITLNSNGDIIDLKIGYIVSLDGYEFITRNTTDAFNKLMNYKKKIKDNKNLFCGAWNDNGTWYIDINILIHKERDAVRVAKKNKQKAYFNLKTSKSVYLDYNIPYYYITSIVKNSQGEEVDKHVLTTFDTLDEVATYTGTSKGRLTHYINDTDATSNIISFNGIRIYKDSINIKEV